MGVRSATNRRPAICEHCGAELGPGRGRVWRDRVGRWRCTCLDSSTCKSRLTPPRTTREELHAAVLRAVEAGALERPPGPREVETEPDEEAWLPLSPATEAALRARLPAWQPPRVKGALPGPTRPVAAPGPPPRPYTPSTVCPPPGAARREWMGCPTCGAVAACYSDVLGIQHWQCSACLAAGRPSCWDTCTSCGETTTSIPAPWVCPHCGRDRRPAPVPATLLARPIPIPGAIILESAEMAEWMARHPAVGRGGLRGAT